MEDKLSKELVAVHAGISLVQLWRWIKDGKFPKADIREGGKVYWSALLVRKALRKLEAKKRHELAARRARLKAQLDALGQV